MGAARQWVLHKHARDMSIGGGREPRAIRGRARPFRGICGANLGRLLTTSLLTKARTLGYRRMVLDTLGDMIAAQTLYRSLGFRDTKPYYVNPMAGVSYMELDLGTAELTAGRS
jgi:GNAT superfamily N-acetyltransferase